MTFKQKMRNNMLGKGKFMNIEEILSAVHQLPQTSFGVSVPATRKLAQKIARYDYTILADETQLQTFELRLLQAFVLGYARADLSELLQQFELFVPYVSDWAVCDSLCQNFKLARIYPEQIWNFIQRYRSSRQEFEVRIVAVILLSHYLNDEYIDRVLNVLDSLYAEKYYAQMGVAWALATICGKYPEKCLQYLQAPNKLNFQTLKMTIRKINESLRVASSIKAKVRAIKINSQL